MLIKASDNSDNPEAVYDQVLQKLQQIFGFDDHTNPILASELKMNMSVPKLMEETRFRTFGEGWLGRLKYLLKIELQTMLGKIFMGLSYKSSKTDWTLYKPDLARQSDHRKFDDMLRLVISGTAEQKRELEYFLNNLHRQSELAYGIYSSDAAIITCMVFTYHRHHIHFVDGSNGGYVKAAKKLKKRLKNLKQR